VTVLHICGKEYAGCPGFIVYGYAGKFCVRSPDRNYFPVAGQTRVTFSYRQPQKNFGSSVTVWRFNPAHISATQISGATSSKWQSKECPNKTPPNGDICT